MADKPKISIISTSTASTSGRPVIWDSDPNITNWDQSGAKWDEWYPQGVAKVQGEKSVVKNYKIFKPKVAIIEEITPVIKKI